MKWITAGLQLGFLVLASAAPVLGAEAPGWEYREEWDLGWRIANFLILAFILYKVGKEPIRKFFNSRRDEIQNEMKTAERAKAEAEENYNNILAEVSKADEKIREITDLIRSQGEKQKERILKEAQVSAERIIADAKASAVFQARKARQELREEMVEIAVQIAEENIRKRITSKDQQNLVNEYMKNLGSIAA